jgi:hypothetical protein
MPLIIGAAVKEETAGWLAEWVDRMITINKPLESWKKW